MDFSGFLRINSRGDDTGTHNQSRSGYRTACFLVLIPFLSFNDDLQGGSVKIFYYHDVYQLIVSMSFRSTSQKFSIDLRVFPFLLLRIYCSPSVKSEMDLSASLGVFLLCTLL